VVEQSGIRAGDEGFKINVTGNTDLKGGVIASTDKAVTENKNTFTTAALSTSDLQNKASYSGNAVGVSLGMGSDGKPTGSAGMGSESGNAISTTQAGISGIAGNANVRSTDAQTGINKIFDAASVQKNIDGQVTITKVFGEQASTAVGDYATKKQNELLNQAASESDQNKRLALLSEASTWEEGGSARTALHVLVGGLTGGAQGALGAGAAALTTPMIADNIAKLNVPDELKSALTLAAGTAVGAVVGGTAGAVTSTNEVANNFLKHTQLMQFKDRYAQCKNQTCKDQVLSDMKGLSDAQDALLKQCATAEACKALVADAVSPTIQEGGFLGFFIQNEKDAIGFCPAGDHACFNTLKAISAKTNQAFLVKGNSGYYANENQLKALTDDLQDRYGLSKMAAIAMAMSVLNPAVTSGIGGALGEKTKSIGNSTSLNKSLASQQQLSELAVRNNQIIAGYGSNVVLRDAPRLVNEYGGNLSDWSKIKSSNYTAADGRQFEIHAYRNVITGQVVEPKSIYLWK
jgi:hypothetical protein